MESFNDKNIDEKLDIMEDRLTKLEENIASIDRKLNQVVDAILGNPLTKTGGFVEDIKILHTKVKSLEDELSVHKDFRKRMVWSTGIVVGMLFAIYHLLMLYINAKGI